MKTIPVHGDGMVRRGGRVREDAMTGPAHGGRSLFDGRTLAGWHSAPRIYGTVFPGGPSVRSVLETRGMTFGEEAEKYPARWTVEDGAIVGEQCEPGIGYGGYLVSDEAFGDFEITIDAWPDWPADTGIMLRRRRDTWEGFQVLIDHRESGSIGGFYGNGLGGLSAVPFALRATYDANGVATGLEADDAATSLEPVTQEKIDRLSYAASVEDFLKVWRWNDWNTFRIRCVGPLPVITTWINGLKIAELDTASVVAPRYDADAAFAVLGERGHIALEVHDNDSLLGDARWGKGARCRWRNISILEL